MKRGIAGFKLKGFVLDPDKIESYPYLAFSRYKKNLVPVSLCPWTRAGAKILGQTPLSRDVPGQNELKKKSSFRTTFS